MNDGVILFCEWKEEGEERAVVCPYLIPGFGESDYCGYYGRDIGEARKRLVNCKIEAVVERANAARRRNKEKEDKKDLNSRQDVKK